MGKLSRSTRRKTMPVSAGAGTKRTDPCTPVWRPTPSTQDCLAIVVWNIPQTYCSILLASLRQCCALLSTCYGLSSRPEIAPCGNCATILAVLRGDSKGVTVTASVWQASFLFAGASQPLAMLYLKVAF